MRRPRRKNDLLCAGLAVGAALLATSAAMPAARADDVGVWASEWLWVDFKKPSKTHGFQLWLDLHQRAWGTNYLAIFRPGVGYEVGHGITLWAGYAFIPSLTAGTADSQKFEHRVWEQIIWNGRVKTVALQGRARLEQRFRQEVNDVGERLRLFGRAGFFFGATSEWGWAVWDEALFNLNTTSLWNLGFDQNRAFTGPFYQSSRGVRVEVGYMNFLVNKKDTGLYDSHVAMVNLFFLVNPFRQPPQAAAPPPASSPPPPAPPPPPSTPAVPESASPAVEPASAAPPAPKSDAAAPSQLSAPVASDLWDAP